MLSLVPTLRIISLVSSIYAALLILFLFGYWGVNGSSSLILGLKFAFSGALILDIVLLAAVYKWWESIWEKFPILSELLFPNLNGRWQIKIHWIGGEDNGTVDATAVIKQSLLKISMEVMSESSDSETLIAQPKKDPESGRPLLFYVYRVTPKQIDQNSGPIYEGAAFLKFDGKKRNSLNGNYFTSRFTRGHFAMQRE